jgi:hypothetical protein
MQVILIDEDITNKNITGEQKSFYRSETLQKCFAKNRSP